MRRRFRSSPDINMVPYIDVLLVLVLIFMCGAANWVDALSVSLPQAAQLSSQPPRSKVIELTKKNRVIISQNDCGELTHLSYQQLGQYLKKNDDIMIQAARDLPYEKVVQLLVLLHKNGFDKAKLAYQAS